MEIDTMQLTMTPKEAVAHVNKYSLMAWDATQSLAAQLIYEVSG